MAKETKQRTYNHIVYFINKPQINMRTDREPSIHTFLFNVGPPNVRHLFAHTFGTLTFASWFVYFTLDVYKVYVRFSFHTGIFLQQSLRLLFACLSVVQSFISLGALFQSLAALMQKLSLPSFIFALSVLLQHINHMPERRIHIGIIYSYFFNSNNPVTYFH